MDVTLVVAIVVLGIFGSMLAVFAFIRPSSSDAVTQEVIEQALTGPVALPDAPVVERGEEDEKAA